MARRDDPVIDWLLQGDPAIRWQVHRDLLGSPEREVARERERVAREGWGARLLALQESDGGWGGGLYNPKWTSTFYTLLLLRDFGLPAKNAQAHRACALLLDRGALPDGGMNFKPGAPSETCISGMALSMLSECHHDDPRLDALVDHVLGEQMPDGGWNCRRRRGATHASVHTTISVLEGLRSYERYRRRKRDAVRSAQRGAQEFLLVHRLFRSHRTGEVIKPELKRFAFPPRWHYDVLRALDYFRAVDAPRDERLRESIELVESKRAADGRWPLDYVYSGSTHFALERPGAPSRWSSLRALRVLAWWQGA